MEDLLGAVDIGATKITSTLFNREGILVRLFQPTVLVGGIDSIPLQVIGMMERCLEETELEIGDLIILGVSSAGPFRRVDGMVELVSPNICGGLAPERGVLENDWTSVPLERVLRGRFRELVIENDAVAGAVAERTFGAGQGCDNLLYVTWSTGIGTGAFVDGRIIRGKNGNAPHGGHVYLGLEGPVCGCGNICDLEATASGSAIGSLYGKGSTAEEVFKAYYRGDEKAVEVVQRAAVYFGKGLASINSVLDTKMIVLGGGVFLNNVDLLMPMVKEFFYRSFPQLSEGVEIIPAQLGMHLGDLAAISLVIPEDLAGEWRRNRPWERMPDTIYLDGIRAV